MAGQIIGLMGGTFDPIHIGHLVAAEAACHRFNMDKVIFIPSGRPPHKEYPVTEARLRYQMTVLATLSNEKFVVSKDEIEREGNSYTVDTLESFQQKYPPETRFYFITGADAVLQIPTWQDGGRLLGMCEFVAVTRTGYTRDELERRTGELERKYGATIHVLPIPTVAVSSTDIRQRLKEGRPIRYMVPEPVFAFIRRYGLYR